MATGTGEGPQSNPEYYRMIANSEPGGDGDTLWVCPRCGDSSGGVAIDSQEGDDPAHWEVSCYADECGWSGYVFQVVDKARAETSRKLCPHCNGSGLAPREDGDGEDDDSEGPDGSGS